jgi:transposase
VLQCDDYSEILDTLSGIKEHDIDFKDKIHINRINMYNDTNKNVFEKDITLINKVVISVQEYRQQNWYDNLKNVIQYIEKYHILPSPHSTNVEIKRLGSWIYTQRKNYKNKTQIMKNKDIHNRWQKFVDEYNEYFQSNEELWNENIKKIIEYINRYHKIPSQHSTNVEIKRLGLWIYTQRKNYKNKTQIMKNKDIHNLWQKFVDEYHEYFQSNEELWNENIEKVIEYINRYHKLPSTESANMEIKKMGRWIGSQKDNYKNKKYIMKNEDIYNRWQKFINEYCEYFQSDEELWNRNIAEVTEYINQYHKLPSRASTNIEIKKMGCWIHIQKNNYKNKIQNMKNKDIYNRWQKFISVYNEYFRSNEETWYGNIAKVTEYINKYHKLPSTESKNAEIKKMGNWFYDQKKRYKNTTCIMKNEDIYKRWQKFMKEYPEYF